MSDASGESLHQVGANDGVLGFGELGEELRAGKILSVDHVNLETGLVTTVESYDDGMTLNTEWFTEPEQSCINCKMGLVEHNRMRPFFRTPNRRNYAMIWLPTIESCYPGSWPGAMFLSNMMKRSGEDFYRLTGAELGGLYGKMEKEVGVIQWQRVGDTFDGLRAEGYEIVYGECDRIWNCESPYMENAIVRMQDSCLPSMNQILHLLGNGTTPKQTEAGLFVEDIDENGNLATNRKCEAGSKNESCSVFCDTLKKYRGKKVFIIPRRDKEILQNGCEFDLLTNVKLPTNGPLDKVIIRNCRFGVDLKTMTVIDLPVQERDRYQRQRVNAFSEYFYDYYLFLEAIKRKVTDRVFPTQDEIKHAIAEAKKSGGRPHPCVAAWFYERLFVIESKGLPRNEVGFYRTFFRDPIGMQNSSEERSEIIWKFAYGGGCLMGKLGYFPQQSGPIFLLSTVDEHEDMPPV
jgi:hypothetical protein